MTALEIYAKIQTARKEGKLLDSTVDHLQEWLSADFFPQWALMSMNELIEQGAWDELNDRFYEYLTFGTGGMRGRTMGRWITPSERGASAEPASPVHPAVGANALNDFNIIRATIGLYRYSERYVRRQRRFETPKVVIAHDVRYFSRHFCELAAATWTQLGGLALMFEGPRSTPQLSFSVRYLKATAGIVITASHNPPHDNGYKVYFEDGGQVVSPHVEGIIEEVNKLELPEIKPFFKKHLERVVILPPDLDEPYLSAVEESVLNPDVIREVKPRVVFTPLHGTGGISAIPLMQRFGIDVIEVEEQQAMDPRFPTLKSPNPEEPEALTRAIEKAISTDTEIVLATDPDSDRMGVAVRAASGNMELLSGNTIGSLLAEYRIVKLKEMGILPPEGSPHAALIKTFVTTPLQAAIARGHGLKLIETLTGFKWMGEKLREYEDKACSRIFEEKGLALNYDGMGAAMRRKVLMQYSTYSVFASEESYGYLASDRVRDKDANAAVILFCELAAYLKKQGQTFGDYLDSIYLKYGYFYERVASIYYEGAVGASKIKNILESYRTDPPQIFGDTAVSKHTDFGRQQIRDADGKDIPPQDFYLFELVNGYSFAVRGSGTEPKIKFYFFGQESVPERDQLDGVKAATQTRVAVLAEAVDRDARQRAG